LIDLFEITAKLEYANWNSWNETEIKVIKEFMISDWECFANRASSEINTQDLEHYSFFLLPKDLLNAWDLSKSKKGLKNFVNFYYYNGTDLINKGLKLKDKLYEVEFVEFINQNGLLENLENEFFEVNEIDKEYAEKVSIVSQMIEQETR